MTNNHRSAFFVSDRTGITAEMLGHSLVTQFDSLKLKETTLPFIDNLDKAREAVAKINATAVADGVRPIIISTLANTAIAAEIGKANALFLDCFQIFIAPLEKELGVNASHEIGRTHNLNDIANYYKRMESVNYALAHDDGESTRDLSEADVVLVGVSRCGKTPTSLYLGLQCGIRCANYPLTPDDFERGALPDSIIRHRDRLFGLTIAADRLQAIRQERKPDSVYSSAKQCRYEVAAAERMMETAGIPILNTSTKSIEELATTILMQRKIDRHIF